VDVLGELVVRELLGGQVVHDICESRRLPGLGYDADADDLPETGVQHPDHGHLAHTRHPGEEVLDLPRGDVEAAADDRLFLRPDTVT
jgi:hypothetical protein